MSSTRYAPCIHLHISDERPCPQCLVHALHLNTQISSPTLPADPTCSICFTDYGTLNPDNHAGETHVLLPCGHTVGNKCLARWLSPAPKGGNGNACPTCNRKLFEPWPKRKQEGAETAAALEDLEEQRAITEQMLRDSIRHHQNMARKARMPTIEEVLLQQHKEDKKAKKMKSGLMERFFGKST